MTDLIPDMFGDLPDTRSQAELMAEFEATCSFYEPIDSGRFAVAFFKSGESADWIRVGDYTDRADAEADAAKRRAGGYKADIVPVWVYAGNGELVR